ncbi:hypothetical protein BH14080 [Bartonella henselae str. Houston-1]|uniref:Uncharacterized protein n=1 Tax=Bartonella henselae (strain ATCC 49882 / DSM 28221 / CCUG 30454 / Houston 1) TaxID=283166 RepID=A0A0H3LZK8_BARHE|nr:hypothetical protein BH14080 [Bartonella henselae str. Houston-1]
MRCCHSSSSITPLKKTYPKNHGVPKITRSQGSKIFKHRAKYSTPQASPSLASGSQEEAFFAITGTISTREIVLTSPTALCRNLHRQNLYKKRKTVHTGHISTFPVKTGHKLRTTRQPSKTMAFQKPRAPKAPKSSNIMPNTPPLKHHPL